MKCTLETINSYRQMTNDISKCYTHFNHPKTEVKQMNHYLEDNRGLLHEIPLYDECMRKINYFRKRNFLVKAQNLPKQFGFEVEVRNLHFDERKPVLAKNLVHGQACISKLFFVFNINNNLLQDNQDYHM
jgi:hypothetical protein